VSGFEVIPAIDLREGRVVRLRRGDPSDITVYGGDPLEVARAWARQGATRLHLVDLDGAFGGAPAQAGLLARVMAGVAIPCQVGGGLRDAAAVGRALAAGADRAVLATAILEHPEMASGLLALHGSDRVVAALDARDGAVVGRGWQAGAPETPLGTALATLLAAGFRRFVVTAIARDGMQLGPDLPLYERVVRDAPGAAIVASGGVSSPADVAALRKIGCSGAILGRALYDGRLSLGDAIAAAVG
jgi:phosphoribosylformimino-5-aminoimidazole carboxamide ribotide isomerase